MLKSLTIFALFFAVALGQSATQGEDFDETLDDFEKEFNQLFNDPEEEKKAADELAKEEEEIKEENEKFANGDATFDEKLYEWSDLPKDEFEKEKEGLLPKDGVRAMGLIETPEWARTTSPEGQAMLDEVYNRLSRASLPASFDASANGIVTPARNQKSCGSCAAFAATATHETCLRNAGVSATGLDLAEQQLVDCAYNPSKGASGCNGAWVGAYQDWMANSNTAHTLYHEADYPYADTSPKLSCQSGNSAWSAGAVISTAAVDYGCDETKLKALVYEFGAVATGLYASDNGFGNYNSGVFTGCSPNSMNHAVTVVGWGNEGGTDYWKIKNSWGSNWGDNGFIKIKQGTCGIGTNCAVTKCTAGGSAAPAPVAPPPAPVPVSQQCDISALFGTSQITGNYNLRVTSGGNTYDSQVTCTNSVCKPRVAGPSNACMYICGKLAC